MKILVGMPKTFHWDEDFKKVSDVLIVDNIDSFGKIRQLMKLHRFACIIPITLEQTKWTDQHKRFVPLVCAPTLAVYQMFNNKKLFAQFMKRSKFNQYIPTVYSETDINQKIDCVEFPVILKRRVGYGSIGSIVIENKNQLMCELTKRQQNEFIIQKYISDPEEYTAHLLLVNGSIRHDICYLSRNETKNYIQAGRTYNYIRLKSMPDLCEFAFEEIFKKVNYTGFACVDFKMIQTDGTDETDGTNGTNGTNETVKTVQIFEINPRIGGSLVANTSDFKEMLTKTTNIFSGCSN